MLSKFLSPGSIPNRSPTVLNDSWLPMVQRNNKSSHYGKQLKMASSV
jgi:hypothetical protein